MKLNFTLLSLLFCFIANARFEKATILFNDGHTESGFVKSFLEDKIKIDLSLTNSLERDLNLNDKTIKFKTSEEGEIRTIATDDIKEVTLFYENNNPVTFRAIFLKGVSIKGEVTDSGCRVLLPYIRRGKINIYGIKFIENGGTMEHPFQSKGMRFYYHNENENYAINYEDFNIASMMYLKQRGINPFKDLFKDCPTIIEKLNAALEGRMEFFKMDSESKAKLKEFRKLNREEREKLAVYHQYNYNNLEKMIAEYETCL